MAAEADIEEEAPKKSKMPLILGIVLAVAGGGGGFFAVNSGILFGSGDDSEDVAEATEPAPEKTEAEPASFIPLEPLVVSIPGNGSARFLRFTGMLDVAPEYAEEVATIVPRIVDVMNGYLRAVDPADFQDPTLLTRLRAQLLRRVQIVAGPDRVNDLLIMEFVIN